MHAGRRFAQVDVFSEQPARGNPVAVVLDADGLGDDDLRGLARWTNLSETTFVLPPRDERADYRVRIFTPAGELPFAGHPTLGTCHAWAEAGGTAAREAVVVQECGAGLVEVRRDGDRWAFVAPPLVRSGPLDDDRRRRTARAVDLRDEDVLGGRWVDNGPGWSALLLRDVDALRRATPRPDADADLDVLGVVAPLHDQPEAVEVRAFFRVDGVWREDPVTGSLNASLAPWLVDSGVAPARYVARQGTALGRAGRVHVRVDGPTVLVGGATRTVVEGTLRGL